MFDDFELPINPMKPGVMDGEQPTPKERRRRSANYAAFKNIAKIISGVALFALMLAVLYVMIVTIIPVWFWSFVFIFVLGVIVVAVDYGITVVARLATWLRSSS